jgi:hypothetical protein
MGVWHWPLGILVVAGILLVLCALDRLLLWMERRGWLYYRKKRPSGGAMSSVLSTMQQLVEPQTPNVYEVTEQAKEKHRLEDDQPTRVDEPPEQSCKKYQPGDEEDRRAK